EGRTAGFGTPISPDLAVITACGPLPMLCRKLPMGRKKPPMEREKLPMECGKLPTECGKLPMERGKLPIERGKLLMGRGKLSMGCEKRVTLPPASYGRGSDARGTERKRSRVHGHCSGFLTGAAQKRPFTLL